MAKSFKFESWMLGALIIPIGIGISIINVINKGTAPLGADCGANDDCVKGLQCIEIDGKSQCTRQCHPGAKSADLQCPEPFTCATVAMRAGVKDVETHWCLASD